MLERAFGAVGGFVEFRVLGPLEVVDADRTVSFTPTREGTLLAILLVHANEVVSVDRLIDDLWRGEPPPSAGPTLANYVKSLRRALEPQRARGTESRVLVTQRPGYL